MKVIPETRFCNKLDIYVFITLALNNNCRKDCVSA